MALENLRSVFSSIKLPRIGSGEEGDGLNTFTSGMGPAEASYKVKVYDPRVSRGRDNITIGTYTGTRLTKLGLMPGAETGIGGLFNTGAELSDASKYSTSFRTINSPLGYEKSPDGNDIIKLGNIGTLSTDVPGSGYFIKKSLMETYTLTRGQEVSLNKYFPTGNSDINLQRTITKDNIPSFNNLTLGQGQKGTLSVSGLDLLTAPINTRLSKISWQTYYNANQTAKTDVGYHYSAFVDRGKLNIRDSNNVNSPDRGTEPYMISPIGRKGRRLNRGGRFTPKKRVKTDTQRLTKFLKSRQGIRFFVNQNLATLPRIPVVKNEDGGLSRVRQRFKTFYNPLTTLAIQRLRLTGQSINTKIDRSGFGLFFDNKYTDSKKFNSISASVASFTEAADKLVTGAKETENFWKEKVGSFLFGDPLVSTGDVATLTDLITHEQGEAEPSLDKAKFIKEAPTIGEGGLITHKDEKDVGTTSIDKDGSLPFYFKDLRDNTYVIFRAYLDGITENISPSWEPTNYVGRSEPVYSYQNTERDISFNLKLYAQNNPELKMIYQKMNRLTSMCYPQYAPDKNAMITTDDTEENSSTAEKTLGQIRMKPPLVRFRMGDLFVGGGLDKNMMLGFIKSIKYTIPDEAVWETGKNL